MAGMKAAPTAGTAKGGAAGPNNVGTGLDGKAGAAGAAGQNQPKLLNEDSMTRLISSQNPKKSTGAVTQPTGGGPMNAYMGQQQLGSPPRAPKPAMAATGPHPPVTAGEPQRSLIKGRG